MQIPFAVEIEEECLEGLFLLKLELGQDNEVNEPINTKSDSGILMVLGHRASGDPGVWLWESLPQSRDRGNTVGKAGET